MMMNNAVYEQLKQILAERFGIHPANIQPSVSLEDELKLDSIDAMDLLLAVNEAFSVRMPEQTLEQIHTISDLVEAIERHKGRVSIRS